MRLDGIPRHDWLAMVFVAAALLLGGGGSPAPHTELLLQVLTCFVLLLWLWLPAAGGRVPVPRDRLVWAIGILALALPALQLLPLPPAWWQALPGQEGRAAALALVGAADEWQPLSQSPARTLAALLSLVPPLFAGFAVAALPVTGRRRVLAAVAATILCSAVLGAAQVSLGGDSLRFYAESHSRYLVGFQANRNAQADILLIGALAAAALFVSVIAAGGLRRRRERTAGRVGTQAWWLVLGGVLALLLLAVVLTGSRMGIGLIAVTLPALWLILRPVSGRLNRRMAAVLAGGAALLLIVGYVLLQGNTMVQRSAERFDARSDPRGELWEDTLFAIDAAWPAGVGLGGFQPAMLAAERLEVLDGTRPNRAHNDYLELALEGGLPAVVIGVAAIALLMALAIRAWRRRPEDRAQILCGCGVLLVIALHSFVDYPLRSMALACMFGVGTGLLAAPPRSGAAPLPGRTVMSNAGVELAA
ncbi:O-antigen ligase family protein [Croceibacterium ferulae]|uniref:O-antigen ligase family protein n=1 Tax=Croceibacterium ferulae TaxID=1854641 RepID=UPI000EAFD4A8|nr:O-antigen ligase family protein [Croceibacterium ferulae]